MTDNDLHVMTTWLQTKEILEFYGDIHSPFTHEQVRDKYGPRVRGEGVVSPFIVELDNTPIGYMQQYPIQADEQKAYGHSTLQVIYGIDQFIGDPTLFSKGIGTKMVLQFIELIQQTTDADLIIMDPEISNTRAIRCYEKCGFSKVKTINNAAHWLMELDLSKM